MRLAVSEMFCRAEGVVWISGASRVSTDASDGACGVPPLSWMMAGPVRLVTGSYTHLTLPTIYSV